MKLLHRTVRSYLLYSALVLLVAIPLFYFIIQALCLQDVDEALQYRKSHLVLQLKEHPALLDRLPWHDLNNEMIIYPAVTRPAEEKKVTLQRYSNLRGAEEPFRELHSFISISGKVYPVVLRISLIGIEDLIQGIVLTAILLMILTLGGLLWINRLQSKRIWRPFYQALAELRRFNVDKMPQLSFTPTLISEFQDLQQVIRQLTGRTYHTYLQQKEFTENAAHEMQTPLAAFQARLEMLMQDETLSGEQADQIQALADTVQRISRLNKGLLLLARIENKQFSKTENIDLVAVLSKIVSSMDIRLQLKRLTLSETCSPCLVRSDPALMDILLSNLVSNAIHYAPEGSCISILTSKDSVEIANAGDPLPFAEEKLFNRFQRGDRADSSGNGLGLAIVRQICDSCHFSIRYQYDGDRHHFKVDFHAKADVGA
jgi:signal transduction histidine kinase